MEEQGRIREEDGRRKKEQGRREKNEMKKKKKMKKKKCSLQGYLYRSTNVSIELNRINPSSFNHRLQPQPTCLLSICI